MHDPDLRPPFITLPVGFFILFIAWTFWPNPVALVSSVIGTVITLRGIGQVIAEAWLYRRPPFWPVVLVGIVWGVLQIGTPHLKWTYICRDQGCEYMLACTHIGYHGEVTIYPKLYEGCPWVTLH